MELMQIEDVRDEKGTFGQYVEKEPPERENEIHYICDRKACENCNPFCHYTTDIKHAREFVEVSSGDYVQKYPLIDHCEIHNGDISTLKSELTEADLAVIEQPVKDKHAELVEAMNKIGNQIAMLNKAVELGFDNMMNYMIFLERL